MRGGGWQRLPGTHSPPTALLPAVAAELETLKIEQLAVLEELRTLLRKAAREQRAAARSVCDALDLSHLRAASAGLSGVVDSVTRLLIEEVLYSRERVFLLRQAVSVLRQQREAADVGLAAPAPPPASRSSGSSAGGADAAAGPATGALAALGLSAAALLPPRRRTKLGDAGRAVLLSWLQAHVRDPYPSDAEKGALAAQTGTSVEYVRCEWEGGGGERGARVTSPPLPHRPLTQHVVHQLPRPPPAQDGAPRGRGRPRRRRPRRRRRHERRRLRLSSRGGRNPHPARRERPEGRLPQISAR